jgi:hypothetical protein
VERSDVFGAVASPPFGGDPPESGLAFTGYGEKQGSCRLSRAHHVPRGRPDHRSRCPRKPAHERPASDLAADRSSVRPFGTARAVSCRHAGKAAATRSRRDGPARATARRRERRPAAAAAGAPSGGPLVDRVHRFRGGGAGRAAPPGRRGDRLTTGGVAVGEPFALSITVAELVTVGLRDGSPTDARPDRSANTDARADRDLATGDSGADGRALRAGQLSAGSDEDALASWSGGPRSADRA